MSRYRWARLLTTILPIVALSLGIQYLLSEYRSLIHLGQIVVFSAIVIGIAMLADRKPNNMKGCATIFSFILAPALALVMVALDMVSQQYWFDPVLRWSGNYRLPALLFIIGAVFAVATSLKRKLRGIKRLQFLHIVEIIAGTALLGVFASLAGWLWLLIGFGLRQAGF